MASQPVAHTRQCQYAGDQQRNSRYGLRSRPQVSSDAFPSEDRVQGHSFHGYHYNDPRFADQSFEVEYDDNAQYPPGEYPEAAYPGVYYYEDVDADTASTQELLDCPRATPAHRPASPQCGEGKGITEVVNMIEQASSQDLRDRVAGEESGITGASSNRGHFEDHTHGGGRVKQHPSANIAAERLSATLSPSSTVTNVHRCRSPVDSNRGDPDRHGPSSASASSQIDNEHRRFTRADGLVDSSHTITPQGIRDTPNENDIPRVDSLNGVRNPPCIGRNRREKGQCENGLSRAINCRSVSGPPRPHRPGDDRPRHLHSQNEEADADTEPGRRANVLLVAAAGLGLTLFSGPRGSANSWPLPGTDAASVATTTALIIPPIHFDVFAPMQTDYVAHPMPTMAPDPLPSSHNLDNSDTSRSKLGRASMGFMLGGIFAGVLFLVLRSLVCKSRRSRESMRGGWREPFSV
ncbi:hypothetical protein G647_01948 [Cladophialophora carrionii CBS 160.54]|uniref:Uncharacterized protein n=1 Tax=Cladophialophora carrionii CBS 160.54 TaxID=1279043 RepID=V9DRF8_9EURO|nr:uncharacterized protein G647_01948 [Cladophialophora carrionii CBS 160.54]ETI29495.1 hypothetical protein G647_01948 [Cladophialophora carrionii CBS 160.54]